MKVKLLKLAAKWRKEADNQVIDLDYGDALTDCATELEILAATLPDAQDESAHTVDDDFQHFMSYSGLWEQPPEIIKLLRMAYRHGANASDPEPLPGEGA